MSFAEAVAPRLDGGSCPHMAVVLRSGRELPAVLVSFYALGARRGGWVVHHALPGQCDLDRERLTAGGLDVGGLEAAGSLVLFEFDPAEAPQDAAERFEPLLADALAEGTVPCGTRASRSVPERSTSRTRPRTTARGTRAFAGAQW